MATGLLRRWWSALADRVPFAPGSGARNPATARFPTGSPRRSPAGGPPAPAVHAPEPPPSPVRSEGALPGGALPLPRCLSVVDGGLRAPDGPACDQPSNRAGSTGERKRDRIASSRQRGTEGRPHRGPAERSGQVAPTARTASSPQFTTDPARGRCRRAPPPALRPAPAGTSPERSAGPRSGRRATHPGGPLTKTSSSNGEGGEGRRRGLLALVILAASLAPLVGFLALDRLFPFPYAALHRPAATVVLAADGAPLRFFLPADERWRLPLPLAEMGADLPRAVVASEDRRFGRHPGVDVLAVARAAWQNLTSGRVVSGASTLPMQLARMADPAPRTLRSSCARPSAPSSSPGTCAATSCSPTTSTSPPTAATSKGSAPPPGSTSARSRGSSRRGRSPCSSPCRARPAASIRRWTPARRGPPATGCCGSSASAGCFTADQVADGLRQPVPTSRRSPPFEAPHFTRFAARAGGRGEPHPHHPGPPPPAPRRAAGGPPHRRPARRGDRQRGGGGDRELSLQAA